MMRLILVCSALLGALGVILGAFGAHGLGPKGLGLSDYAIGVWKTGVEYHMYHSLALLALVALSERYLHQGWAMAAGVLWIVGIVLFSGSLYALALNMRGIGLLTPLGGLLMIAGWGCAAIAALTAKASL